MNDKMALTTLMRLYQSFVRLNTHLHAVENVSVSKLERLLEQSVASLPIDLFLSRPPRRRLTILASRYVDSIAHVVE